MTLKAESMLTALVCCMRNMFRRISRPKEGAAAATSVDGGGGGSSSSSAAPEPEMVLVNLLKAVRDVEIKSDDYDSVLQSMESKLTTLIPIVKEQKDRFDEMLEDRDEATMKSWEQIMRGEELVRMMSKSSTSGFGCCFKSKKQNNGLLNEAQKLDTSFDTLANGVKRNTRAEVQVKREKVPEDHGKAKVTKGNKDKVEDEKDSTPDQAKVSGTAMAKGNQDKEEDAYQDKAKVDVGDKKNAGIQISDKMEKNQEDKEKMNVDVKLKAVGIDIQQEKVDVHAEEKYSAHDRVEGTLQDKVKIDVPTKEKGIQDHKVEDIQKEKAKVDLAKETIIQGQVEKPRQDKTKVAVSAKERGMQGRVEDTQQDKTKVDIPDKYKDIQDKVEVIEKDNAQVIVRAKETGIQDKVDSAHDSVEDTPQDKAKIDVTTKEKGIQDHKVEDTQKEKAKVDLAKETIILGKVEKPWKDKMTVAVSAKERGMQGRVEDTQQDKTKVDIPDKYKGIQDKVEVIEKDNAQVIVRAKETGIQDKIEDPRQDKVKVGVHAKERGMQDKVEDTRQEKTKADVPINETSIQDKIEDAQQDSVKFYNRVKETSTQDKVEETRQDKTKVDFHTKDKGIQDKVENIWQDNEKVDVRAKERSIPNKVEDTWQDRTKANVRSKETSIQDKTKVDVRNEVKGIQEKVEDTRQDNAKVDISFKEKVEEPRDKVKNNQVKVKPKDTHMEMKDYQENVQKDIQDKMDTRKEVKDKRQEDKYTRIDQVKENGAVVKGDQDKVKHSPNKVTLEETKGMQDKLTGSHKQVKNIPKEEAKGIHRQVQDGKDTNGEMKNILDNLNYVSLTKRTISLHPSVVPEPPEFTVGLDGYLRELKKELFKDGMSSFVLSGPGGCGKTTLAKKLCRDKQVEVKFKDNIFFITVSKTLNLKIIIHQLCLQKGGSMPAFQSDEDAVDHLQKLLKEIGPKPILLVLDDVWPGTDSLLDKFKFQLSNYKVLVTSRSVFPRFGSTYKLETLSKEDSKILFCHSASLPNGSFPHVDEDVVNKIVNACKGSPLALTVVGRSLRGRPRTTWHNRLMEWPTGNNIFEVNTELLNCLKSSLDSLDSKILQDCCMDLGSFPEGQLIHISALIDMWGILYELNEDGLNSATNLHEMSDLSLVDLVVSRKEASEVEGYGDQFVMQHDVLRELVIHLSELNPIEKRERLVIDINGNKFPKWWRGQKQQFIGARLLSISTDEMFSSNWINLQAPEVEVLVLNFCSENYTLPEFLMNMDRLKALIVTGYGYFLLEIRNIQALGNLSRLERIRFERVSNILLALTSVQLKSLQKLSLVRCSIMEQAFNVINIRIAGVLPSLTEMNIDHCSHLYQLPVQLCEIVSLKKLRITRCHELFTLPKDIRRLVNLEVLRLTSCINLSELPDTIGSLSKLRILDVSGCLSIKRLPDQIGELRSLRRLYMKGCSNCELPKSTSKLRFLEHVICDEETAALWKPFMHHLSHLKITS